MQTAPFHLSTWQKKQVTLLYHFASLDYLKGLQQRLNALIGVVDPTLDLAKRQRRDELLTDTRWGTRNTSQNWANHGWSFLADFQLKVATDIAKRAFEVYKVTGANQCARGMAEQSTDWMTPDEEDNFEDRFEQISLYAMNIDYTMDKTHKAGRWSDFGLAEALDEYPEAIIRPPALRLRADVTGQTGTVPPRTGVYLPVDDMNGTPQFCWTGTPAGPLQECRTLNQLGLEALAVVGRDDLWANEERMHAFVQAHLMDPRLTSDSFFADSKTDPSLAPSLIARQAFTSRPCSWIYVEQIPGEVENLSEPSPTTVVVGGPRVEAGALCPQPGYYFTPARPNSRRYFAKNAIMPHIGGDYGATIWQWDGNQN